MGAISEEFFQRHRKAITLGVLVTVLAPGLVRGISQIVADYKTYKAAEPDIVAEMDTYGIVEMTAHYDRPAAHPETGIETIPDVPLHPRSHLLRRGEGYHYVNSDYDPEKRARRA
jgi:hypothetical protein